MRKSVWRGEARCVLVNQVASQPQHILWERVGGRGPRGHIKQWLFVVNKVRAACRGLKLPLPLSFSFSFLLSLSLTLSSSHWPQHHGISSSRAASPDCLSNKSTLAFSRTLFICMHRPMSLAPTRTKGETVLIKCKAAARRVNMCSRKSSESETSCC